MSRRSAIRTARRGQMSPYAFAFCMLFLIVGLLLNKPLTKLLLKLCKGNEKVGIRIFLLIILLITWILFRLLKPQLVYLRTNLVDFLFGH